MTISITGSGLQVINPSGTTGITKATITAKSSASGSSTAANIRFTGISLSGGPGLVGAISPQHTIVKGGVPVTTFTQAEIDAGVIGYVGYAPNVLTEYITVRYSVIDNNTTPPGTASGSFQLRYPIPDKSPEGTPGDWPVPKNKDSKATNSQFNWVDLKNPATQIIFTVQDVLQYGDLYFKGVKQVLPGKPFTFTQDDVNKGYISYKSFPTVDANTDYLVFKVRDTNGNWSGLNPGEIYNEADANVYRMKIIIDDLHLQVVKANAEVDKCATITLDTDVFLSSDEDDPGLVITYTLLDNTLDPKYHVRFGKLKKNGVELKTGDTWTQADIDAGAITYQQGCTDDPYDTFHFSAQTTKDLIKDATYTIKLIPDFAPAVTINLLEVPQCETKVVLQANIDIVDPEGLTPDQIVVRNDSSQPGPQHGQMLFNGSPITDTPFTFADILAGKLAYKHDCTDHDPLTDAWPFIVEDKNNSTSYVLPIAIIVPENKPPYMVENPCHECERNGEVSWGVDEFEFDDDDTDPNLVTLRFTGLPEFGEFYINGAVVDTSTIYKLSEWKNLTFRYVAKTPTNSDKGDLIPFELNDNRLSNKQEGLAVCISYPPPPIICPTIINQDLRTSYGAIKAITEVDLFATTEGVLPRDLVWTLTKGPSEGTLTKDGSAMIPNDVTFGVWTSQDILDMRIAYSHSGVGTPSSDQFDFTVTNGFCSLGGTYIINFLPGLRVDVNEILEVDQGDTGTIDALHLHSTSGMVTTDDDLIYTVTTLPTVGKMFKDGVEVVLGETFTQTDINNNTITYTPDVTQSDQDHDSFYFDVTDGYDTKHDIFKILINLIDQPPNVVINELVVGELACAPITVNNIKVTDKNSADSQLRFTLLNLPVWGTLFLSNTEIKQDAVNTVAFTYADIIDGKLLYCETEIGATLDSFDFTITDSGGNITGLLTLPIRIVPPPPPTLVNNGMITDPCVPRGITGQTLGLNDVRSAIDKALYVFTVKIPPQLGTLAVNGLGLSAGGTFTLKDILANSLTYTGATWHTDVPDSFTFDVNGPDFEDHDKVYNITFREVNNPPWVCVNQGIDLFENETKTITINMLQMCDVDLDYDSVNDPDPESAEGDENNTPNDAGNYRLGAVLSPADVDTSGNAYTTVRIQYPGEIYSVDFNVTAGSARLYVRDQNLNILVNSPCHQSSTGLKNYPFTPNGASETITIEVIENCVTTGVTPAAWSLNLKKV